MPNLFFFTGEHTPMREEKLQFWQSEFAKKHGDINLEVVEDAVKVGVPQLMTMIESQPFLAEKRMVVIKGVPAAAHQKSKLDTEALEPLLDSIPESVLVIFVSAKPDKRGRFYKLLAKKATVENFELPKGKALLSWAAQRLGEQGKRIDSRALETLVFYCGEDPQRLQQEIDKLSLLDFDQISVAEVEKYVSATPEAQVFRALDLIGKRPAHEVSQALEDLIKRGEEPLMVFFMLVRQIRLLLQVRSLLDEGTPTAVIQKRLKIAPFQVNMLKSQAEYLSFQQLSKSLIRLQEIDAGVKTGKIPLQSGNPGIFQMHIDRLLHREMAKS